MCAGGAKRWNGLWWEGGPCAALRVVLGGWHQLRNLHLEPPGCDPLTSMPSGTSFLLSNLNHQASLVRFASFVGIVLLEKCLFHRFPIAKAQAWIAGILLK